MFTVSVALNITEVQVQSINSHSLQPCMLNAEDLHDDDPVDGAFSRHERERRRRPARPTNSARKAWS